MSFCVDLVSPHPDGRMLVYGLMMGLPALGFLLYLVVHTKDCIGKLRQSQSHLMTTYYGFVWAVTVLSVLRCFIQLGSVSNRHVTLWNMLWLVNRFGMLLLEACVLVYLFEGYFHHGFKALLQTLKLSGAFAFTDTFVKLLLLTVFHVPLFLSGATSAGSTAADMVWSKWGFWLAHCVVLMLVYASVLVLPHTKYRDLMPAKISFYRYIQILLILNCLGTIGAALIGSKLTSGYCVYGISNWLYWAFYPPLLYCTFLSDFFADKALDLDSAYYAEMLDAGVFDDDR